MTIWRMRFACWITKATNTHSEYVILIAFHVKNDYANAPQCYVILTLHVLLTVHFSLSVASDFKLCSSFIHIPRNLAVCDSS
jgi:hypothetical protein